MSEILKQWATPEGVIALIALTSALTMLLARFARNMGFGDAAARIEAVSERAALAEKALAATIQGVQGAKLSLDPAAVTELTGRLRTMHAAAGVEEIVQPIVKELNENPQPLPKVVEAVRAATARVPRRVS